MIIESPLLKVINDKSTTITRVAYNDTIPLDVNSMSPSEISGMYHSTHVFQAVHAPNRLINKSFEVSKADGFQVISLEEAEDIVLNTGPIKEIYDDTAQLSNTSCGDGLVSLLAHFNRRANLIAARTRISAGNMVLANPSVIKRVEWITYGGKVFTHYETPVVVGRWLKVGEFLGGLVVFTSDALPVDEAVVLFSPDDFNSYVLLKNEEECYLITDSKIHRSEYMSDIEDFIQRIKIVDRQ
jgi:hypothetical protein